MSVKHNLRILFSLPKTIYFNFKVLKFKEAVRLPFFVDKDIEFGTLYRGVIKVLFDARRFDIRFGDFYLDGIPKESRGFLGMSSNSSIVFSGQATFSSGITLRTIGNSTIKIGTNFFCNKNCCIVSRESISIGDDVLIGWNVNIRDSDGETHVICVDGNKHINRKAINVSNHVWICAYSHILKGVELADNSVVAYNSTVNKSFCNESGIIIAGSPAKIVKRNVQWIR